jgi:glycosyltransferase involved in cell wall biosynthesis
MSSKIKILVDGRWFDSFYSGVTTYLKGLYSTVAQDSRFSITILGVNIENLKNDFPQNINFIELNSKSKIKWLNYDIPNIISRYHFDYAHFQYICPLTKNCKYIVTLHDLLFLDYKDMFPLSYIFKKSFLFYFSAKRADILLTVSEFSKKRIAHHFNIREKLIRVVPNGILERFNNDSATKDVLIKYGIKKYILFVSRIEPRKNHLTLLKAFFELNLFKEYHLIFIGKKSINVIQLEEYYNNLAPAIRDRIIFIENVSEEDLYSFYANTSLFVYPSFSEGFGIPPIEAICSGAKVICSNATALGDFDFLSDFQFSPNNLEEIKSKLIHTLNDRNYPISNFQKIIKDRYAWKTIGENFKEIILQDYQHKTT